MASHSRPSSVGKTLDIKLVYEEPALVKAHLEARSVDPDVINHVIPELNRLFEKRLELIKTRDAAKHARNVLSKSIGQLMQDQSQDVVQKERQVEELKQQVVDATTTANATDNELAQVDEASRIHFSSLPNLLDDSVPFGKGDEDNELVYEWGDQYKLVATSEEEFKWHDELASGLGGFWAEEAARLSGARFSVLAGSVAQLERAISSFFLDTHVNQHGYTEVSVPIIVSRSILQGTGQLPKFEDDLFRVNHSVHGEDGFLIPTAEVPLTSLWSNTIIEDASTLPRSLVSSTPCFRAEAGSHGKDVKGLMRLHQFNKVELVKITTPESSHEEHEKLTRHAEELLRLLKLPYRKMKLCSGDIGFSAKMCYDLEVWCPSQQAYREISSCSNCGDFQAKRMGLRYREQDVDNTDLVPSDGSSSHQVANISSKKLQKIKARGVARHCHTINGSGLAVGRTLLAILENYQQKDGSVKIPEVLVPYMGGKELLTPKTSAH